MLAFNVNEVLGPRDLHLNPGYLMPPRRKMLLLQNFVPVLVRPRSFVNADRDTTPLI